MAHFSVQGMQEFESKKNPVWQAEQIFMEVGQDRQFEIEQTSQAPNELAMGK